MKTSESFPYLVDVIFAELEAASRVVIDCQPVDETNMAIHENLRVTAVNGIGSAFHFLHRIKHMKAEAMEKLRETLPQIIPADREAFIDLAMRRVRKINLSIEVIRLPGPPEPQHYTVQWAHRTLTCRHRGTATIDPEILEQALGQTRRHAYMFYLVTRRLEERINGCAGSTFSIMVSAADRSGDKPEKKFKLSCTVAFFSALLRVLCDRNLVENPNVSELCRRFAGACYTSRQEVLSAHSLRNCFDDPSPDVLENLLQETRLVEKYIVAFISRQRR